MANDEKVVVQTQSKGLRRIFEHQLRSQAPAAAAATAAAAGLGVFDIFETVPTPFERLIGKFRPCTVVSPHFRKHLTGTASAGVAGGRGVGVGASLEAVDLDVGLGVAKVSLTADAGRKGQFGLSLDTVLPGFSVLHTSASLTPLEFASKPRHFSVPKNLPAIFHSTTSPDRIEERELYTLSISTPFFINSSHPTPFPDSPSLPGPGPTPMLGEVETQLFASAWSGHRNQQPHELLAAGGALRACSKHSRALLAAGTSSDGAFAQTVFAAGPLLASAGAGRALINGPPRQLQRGYGQVQASSWALAGLHGGKRVGKRGVRAVGSVQGGVVGGKGCLSAGVGAETSFGGAKVTVMATLGLGDLPRELISVSVSL